MSSVLPAKSTRVGALDSMIMRVHCEDLACRPSTQFAGINPQAQAEMNFRKDKLARFVRRALFPCTTSGGRAIANHKLWPRVFFLLRQGGIWFKAAAAPRLIHSACPHDDQLFAFYKTLRVHRRIAAAHTNGQQLSNLFRDGKQPWHRFERTPTI